MANKTRKYRTHLGCDAQPRRKYVRGECQHNHRHNPGFILFPLFTAAPPPHFLFFYSNNNNHQPKQQNLRHRHHHNHNHNYQRFSLVCMYTDIALLSWNVFFFRWLFWSCDTQASDHVPFFPDVDISIQVLGFWFVWLFTVPSLRARKPGASEKVALDIAFLATPVVSFALPFVTKVSKQAVGFCVFAFVCGYYNRPREMRTRRPPCGWRLWRRCLCVVWWCLLPVTTCHNRF